MRSSLIGLMTQARSDRQSFEYVVINIHLKIEEKNILFCAEHIIGL